MGEELEFSTFSNVIDGGNTHTKTVAHGTNPATLEQLPAVPISTKADIDTAIQAARLAFKDWKRSELADRRRRLQDFAQAILSYKKEFARLLVQEQGKPLFVAEIEVDDAVRWITGTAKLELPSEIVEDTPNRHVVTNYLPLGVVVGIVPWNFPLMLLAGKLAPAVFAGNCIIIKPSPFTPYCGLKVVELAQKFFPRGVVQVLSGDDSLGPQLTARPDIEKISFTGSTATGKKVMESASKNLTRITLELGGNDPAIICANIDIAKVATKIAALAFYNSGQVCIAIKRVYVHSSIYDQFREALVNIVNNYQVGNGLEKDVFLGPVQNSLQFERVQEFLEDIRMRSQKVLIGGDTMNTTEGYFIRPTIIDNPDDNSKIVTEEPFGPIVPLLSWSDEKDVISRANNTDMGLGASVWSADVEQATRIAEQIDAGSVWINEHMGILPNAHFSGHKSSGIGGEWGVDGLRSYCSPRTIYINR